MVVEVSQSMWAGNKHTNFSPTRPRTQKIENSQPPLIHAMQFSQALILGNWISYPFLFSNYFLILFLALDVDVEWKSAV